MKIVINIRLFLSHFSLTTEVVVMFAAEEAEKGLVVVKVLGSGEQTTHATADVVTAVAANLSKQEDV